MSDTLTQPKRSPQVIPTKAKELLTDRHGAIPVWVRAPVIGPEPHCGLTRPYLYQKAKEGHIRSVSIREPGKIKGVRLFNLPSIISYIERCEANATQPAPLPQQTAAVAA